jgi:myo-inositol-1-phosphate synthase
MGAVATTFVAGVDAIRRGRTDAVGSLAELGQMRSGGDLAPIRETLNLPRLEELSFGGWDIYPDTAFDAATRAGVLEPHDLEASREVLGSLKPMPAVFDQDWVKNIDGPNVKTESNKYEQAQALVEDIESFGSTSGCDRMVGVWCGSTERWVELDEVHLDPDAFEKGLENDHPAISPSMMYAWAFVQAGVPYANGATNRAVDVPAISKLAADRGVPIAGKDFKTGQTLMKTIIAPGLASRMIGVKGWYSTNILGNTDGAVLDDPGSFKTKEESKLSVLQSILNADTHPELYGEMTHKVRIDYYPPRGDDKEGWDNIDIRGWFDYPMQIKINFLCKDSILAAPLVLDLSLFLDAAARDGRGGVQDWLSFYFKSPQPQPGELPLHDLFAQRELLFSALESMA